MALWIGHQYEYKNICLMTLSIEDIFEVAASIEERGILFEGAIKNLMSEMEKVNKEEFPKRAILFFRPQVEDSHKGYETKSSVKNYSVLHHVTTKKKICVKVLNSQLCFFLCLYSLWI